MSRVRRTLRMLLCMLVVLGLVPGATELVENLEHILHDGHLRHGETHELAHADESCAPETDEHGCTPLSHDCGCCASISGLPDVPSPDLQAPLATSIGTRLGSITDRGPPSRDV